MVSNIGRAYYLSRLLKTILTSVSFEMREKFQFLGQARRQKVEMLGIGQEFFFNLIQCSILYICMIQSDSVFETQINTDNDWH